MAEGAQVFISVLTMVRLQVVRVVAETLGRVQAQELLDKAPIKGFAHLPMLRSDTLMLSYAEARVRVDRIAHVLVQDLGLVPGNRVLLRGGNSIAMALCMLAVMKAGLVAVATMPLLRAKELGDIIDKSEPAAALCDVALLKELQLAQAEHPVLRTIIAFNAVVGEGEPDSLIGPVGSAAGTRTRREIAW